MQFSEIMWTFCLLQLKFLYIIYTCCNNVFIEKCWHCK